MCGGRLGGILCANVVEADVWEACEKDLGNGEDALGLKRERVILGSNAVEARDGVVDPAAHVADARVGEGGLLDEVELVKVA